MMKSKDDITNREILEVLTVFSEHMDTKIGSLEGTIGSMDTRIGSIESRLTSIESQMVTKDYLDRKLWDLQGDMVAMTRREIERHESRLHTTTG